MLFLNHALASVIEVLHCQHRSQRSNLLWLMVKERIGELWWWHCWSSRTIRLSKRFHKFDFAVVGLNHVFISCLNGKIDMNVGKRIWYYRYLVDITIPKMIILMLKWVSHWVIGSNSRATLYWDQIKVQPACCNLWACPKQGMPEIGTDDLIGWPIQGGCEIVKTIQGKPCIRY